MSLVISDLSKSRHGTSLLNGVNLELRSGAIHGLFGRNGAGKSTLLNIIANRLVADAGSVSFHETVHRSAWRGEAGCRALRADRYRVA